MPNGEESESRAKDREEAKARTEAKARLVGPYGRTGLGILMMLLGGTVLYLLIALWPAVQAAATPDDDAGATTIETVEFFFGLLEWTPTAETALLALVVLSGVLGSFIHAAVSFTDYVGNRVLANSWIWWYLLRALVGSSLALLFYFVIRGGFLGAGTSAADSNPYGIAAISGLVGLFSKQATDKLSEVFDTAFAVRDGGDKARGDSIKNPEPTLTASEPLRLKRGPQLEFALMGSGFSDVSSVHVERADGAAVPLTIKRIEPQRITLKLDVDDIDAPGTLRVTVVNPEPGGGTSNALEIPVDPEDLVGPPNGGAAGPAGELVGAAPEVQGATGDVVEAEPDLEPDDDLDGCDLDFAEEAVSDADVDALLAAPAEPMKEQSEEDWEKEEGN